MSDVRPLAIVGHEVFISLRGQWLVVMRIHREPFFVPCKVGSKAKLLSACPLVVARPLLLALCRGVPGVAAVLF